MAESSIEINKVLPNGIAANFSADNEVVNSMYPSHEESSDVLSIRLGHKTVGFNTQLRFMNDGLGKKAVLGNTKTSTCPVATDCGSCALAGSGLTVVQMSERNCARANTAVGFEAIEQEPEGRFMLLPLTNKVLVADESILIPEHNGNQLMQYRLPDAMAVVFTDSWLYARGLDTAAFAMNGADGSFGVVKTKIQDEQLYIPFCSLRGNMGDRDEDAQIIRQAINAYMDREGIVGEERDSVIETMKVDITLSASAELKNFAHKIQIPEAGTQYEKQLREKYPELIELANGEITPRIVLHDQYAGALDRGHIFRESDAWLGEQADPYSPTSCPLNGETCNVDYRAETEYSIMRQLNLMGIAPENIAYDDSKALDPAAPDNNMASNRREQLSGLPIKNTSRTLNGIKVEIDGPVERLRDFKLAAGIEAVGMLFDKAPDYPQPDMSDPFVAMYELRMGHRSPPKELWNTVAVRKEARALGYHPMAYWLSCSTSSEDSTSEAYNHWMTEISKF